MRNDTIDSGKVGTAGTSFTVHTHTAGPGTVTVDGNGMMNKTDSVPADEP